MYNKVKQTKKNLQEYFHPSSLNHLKYAHVQCQEAKKGPKKPAGSKFYRRRQCSAPLGVMTLFGWAHRVRCTVQIELPIDRGWRISLTWAAGIRCVHYIEPSRRTEQLCYTQGVYESFLVQRLSGILQPHRPRTVQGRAPLSYSMGGPN